MKRMGIGSYTWRTALLFCAVLCLPGGGASAQEPSALARDIRANGERLKEGFCDGCETGAGTDMGRLFIQQALEQGMEVPVEVKARLGDETAEQSLVELFTKELDPAK